MNLPIDYLLWDVNQVKNSIMRLPIVSLPFNVSTGYKYKETFYTLVSIMVWLDGILLFLMRIWIWQKVFKIVLLKENVHKLLHSF